ncbi:ubiquitin protein ligase E3A isoform X2 [Oratosquilla oratoria]|uniref:ubiquitin protein ligase E3A isoform X2 n=1 Tax=Oratosquilla oratoria TaxID=337810 RepID=UPI003F7578F5
MRAHRSRCHISHRFQLGDTSSRMAYHNTEELISEVEKRPALWDPSKEGSGGIAHRRPTAGTCCGGGAMEGKEVDMKRAAAQLIERYYFQLTDGCGNPNCTNSDCASSGKVGQLTKNEAAGKALQLFAARAKLCPTHHVMVAKTTRTEGNGSSNAMPSQTSGGQCAMQVLSMASASSSSPLPSSNVPPLLSPINAVTPQDTECLTEEILKETISECRAADNYAKLRRQLWAVFSNEIALRQSFLKNTDTKKEEMVTCDITKEEIRAQERDLDKDFDSQETLEEKMDSSMSDKMENGDVKRQDMEINVDIESLRRSYEMLFDCPEKEFCGTLMNAMVSLLSDSLSIQVRVHKDMFNANPDNINLFVIIFEISAMTWTEYIEVVMLELCKVASHLCLEDHVRLTRYFSTYTPARLKSLVETLHHVITFKIMTEFPREYFINEEESITSATKVMKLLYYANILGGTLDEPLLKDLPPEANDPMDSSDDPFMAMSHESKEPKQKYEDPLGQALGIHVLDSRDPLIPFSEFSHDLLSDQIEMDRDFAYYKAGSDKFSFMHYPFILTPATKALGLYYDNRIRMYSERRMSIYQTVMEGTPANPYLKLKIRRDHIIDDALVELEMVALENPGDLKKQLVVEFEGEQGIDEGGVSKEFFQLIVEQIFNPDYAMFCYNCETHTFWFNPTSFESDAQFTLIGIVLGLAIYNNVILDVHFPPVMYKKLSGKRGSFHDLKEWNTTLYRSLVELLEYEGDDMEEVFMQSYRIGYQDVFGANLTHDLKPDGENVLVNQSNKQDFVKQYADFLLNKSVERQFHAFRRGFSMVTDDSPLGHLFRPEELELLVCGSQNYDFMELMKSTEYDGGYTVNTAIVKAFWEIVHDMSDEDKKKLLQFTTGSARVPVGGLARLKLIIARHGPDCDRLPTAHTCFNVLLLPEYSSKEKLQDRLYKAIGYFQGFGML